MAREQVLHVDRAAERLGRGQNDYNNARNCCRPGNLDDCGGAREDDNLPDSIGGLAKTTARDYFPCVDSFGSACFPSLLTGRRTQSPPLIEV